MSDLNQALVEAVEKLNRTDGEGMTVASALRAAAEKEGIVKDCDYCGEMMLAGRRFCGDVCEMRHESSSARGW